ncbi:MAG: ABC transporter ATP-binding protein [Alphaproteobacteria bacterium]|nr:ABC transporter ATP-binding protein [Alphaproteobacteria bacterium]MBU0796917.1 ABC transporter ATP-binding protein [Alphaproteobacteria bacterium]MBU0886439.1 ABC transporter ATP-binding protein [Alphaproteobacteria bacterium]MBU1812338.1 ABC transporter ATP-binding protein [Alphaproteobacteria bacterium]
MAGIDIDGITKNFGRTEVLRRVDLDIRAGEFMTLVGPSGCGKSTLLRIVAGLELQSSGSVRIADTPVDSLRPRDRDLAMVFQSYALYPHLTVGENIAVPLRMRQLKGHQRWPYLGALMPGARDIERAIAAEVGSVADMLDIGHLLARKPGQLSGGQRQRVALGRAMVRHPKAFLMDEPLSNLDAKLRVHMRAEIAQLHRRLGTTFIYVTHDQSEAMTMSDRIAVMMDGAILQVAAPDTVYNDPTDIRVAEFIGSPKINVLPAMVRADGSLAVEDSIIAVEAGAAPGEPVTLAFRPEHALLADPEQAALRGRIAHVENLGSDILVHVRVGESGQPPLVVRTAPNGHRHEIGEKTGIDLSSRLPLLFGRDGKRIGVASARQREAAHG